MTVRCRWLWAGGGMLLGLLMTPFILFATFEILAEMNKPKGACLSQPISLARKGERVSCEVKVRKEGPYVIELQFSYKQENEEDKKRVKKIVWDAFEDERNTQSSSDALLGFRVEIIKMIQDRPYKLADKEIFDPQITSSLYGYTNTDPYSYINAEIFGAVLDKGIYVINVETTKVSSEFASIKSNIVFQQGYWGK